jgi:hypothetical protein
VQLRIGLEKRMLHEWGAVVNIEEGGVGDWGWMVKPRSKNISMKGPLNCRSLGFARDDKGEGYASMGHWFVGDLAKAIVGLRPSFSSQVRWGEPGAPVDCLRQSVGL